MENEKLQDVFEEIKNETPEEVQNQAESLDENQQEKGKVADSKQEEPPQEEQPTSEEAAVTAEDKTEESEEAHLSSEEEPNNQEEEEEEPDFEHADKEELVVKIRELRNEDDMRALDRMLRALKPRFDDLYEFSKNEALQRFVSDGNEADAFEYHGDELDKEFITLYNQLRNKRNKYYKDLEEQKEGNLKKKERILDQLREIVDGEESAESINEVRQLQTEWKKIGPVPGAMNKTLWASYNALLDRYYDKRSIYFELKDLDRKKNMQLKEELCEKAEALAQSEDLRAAIVQLNDLHDEYKHIGPVPKEHQEELWQRFKAASDAIYAKRKAHFEELKKEFEANLEKKRALIQEVEAFASFSSDRITEWNAKTKELLEIQKKWEAIGGIPKDKAKATNKAFWNAFKAFFAKKNQFFKELESHREENLKKKLELIEKAEALKDSEDWNSTADKLKHLQTVWKDIGPVPEKARNETYKRFKAACDHFFNRRREQNQEQFKEYEQNLQLKLQVCDQLEQEAMKENPDLDTLYDLVDNFNAIGFVPKNAIKKIRKRFDEVKEKIFANGTIGEEDLRALRNHIEMGHLKNTPGGERKLHRKEQSIRRKISSLENDIATWNTNMEFFADSATADKLKAEMQQKIAAAEKELEDLKTQLAAISL